MVLSDRTSSARLRWSIRATRVYFVTTGLDPVVHDAVTEATRAQVCMCLSAAWIAGSSPATTTSLTGAGRSGPATQRRGAGQSGRAPRTSGE